MTVNPLGAVVIWDGENPRTFTGRARTAISGGQLVVVSGAANVLSSGADSYAVTDIVVDILQNNNYCNGIALNTVGSNSNVTVATRGVYIARSADVISGGHAVIPYSGTAQGFVAGNTSISYSGTIVGRAITAAASGTNNYFLVDLHV